MTLILSNFRKQVFMGENSGFLCELPYACLTTMNIESNFSSKDLQVVMENQ